MEPISNDKEGRSPVLSTNDYRLATSDRSPREALLSWYLENGRHDLPWRRTKDPYRIYLSEIMLQQTQVSTVLERFYFPFLERFPTLRDVAEAEEEAVLKAWEGLGYYSRARNLHRTACLTGGQLPETAEELEKLPGIGRSTARAIACFAFGEALPILDANIRRILYRHFRRRQATEKELWRMARRLFDPAHAYEWNQGMMDLGATVCAPKAPRCEGCPLAESCRGRAHPERYPAPKKRTVIPVRRRRILLHQRDGVWAMQRSRERFHGGLWYFPQTVATVEGEHLGNLRQSYSHFTLEAEVWQVPSLPPELSQEVTYHASETIEAAPLGGIDRKVFAVYIR